MKSLFFLFRFVSLSHLLSDFFHSYFATFTHVKRFALCLPITFFFISSYNIINATDEYVTTTTTTDERFLSRSFFFPLASPLLLFFGYYVLMYSLKFVARQSSYLFKSDQFGQHIQHVNHNQVYHCFILD